ncbi:NAD-dependent epimerase/dehydratase family protein [Rhodoferax antarcticus]|uniref:NAD-dependent epimerase/dehydratase family protein n=1 Tax=Rhodoferax antarcticus TaxID=81479 RepID=UPI0022249608|nr:NAD(P)-dependent oxidoreductase [Rhodoferax antarcticus]MCW2312610.1 nucleoside-diphosphate-sugar epimerase [Rhodoferax antarcticus]
MKVLLTGATGFIGSQLAYRLIAEDHEVAIVVRPDSQLNILQAVLPRIQVHVYDGSYASLLHALQAAQPEVVIHVASLFLAQHKPEDVARLVESNLSFPTELLEAMSQLGIKQLINTGTSWEHYQNEAYNPVNLYAATKQAFKALLTYYVEAQGFKAITLKLFDTYGPGDTRPKLFTFLRKTAKSGETLCMSPGEQMLDLVYIDDVINAYLIAANRLVQNEVHQQETFVVSSEKPMKLRDLVTIYCQLLGKQLSIQWGARPYRPREVMIPWNKGDRLPGWEPRIALEDGIKRAFASADSDK